MTGKPGRTKSYHEDLWWCIVWQHLANNHSIKKTVQNLSVAESTVWRIEDRFGQIGCVAPNQAIPQVHWLCAHDELVLMELVCKNPLLYLQNMLVEPLEPMALLPLSVGHSRGWVLQLRNVTLWEKNTKQRFQCRTYSSMFLMNLFVIERMHWDNLVIHFMGFLLTAPDSSGRKRFSAIEIITAAALMEMYSMVLCIFPLFPTDAV